MFKNGVASSSASHDIQGQTLAIVKIIFVAFIWGTQPLGAVDLTEI